MAAKGELRLCSYETPQTTYISHVHFIHLLLYGVIWGAFFQVKLLYNYSYYTGRIRIPTQLFLLLGDMGCCCCSITIPIQPTQPAHGRGNSAVRTT